jgi:hypothetical protein
MSTTSKSFSEREAALKAEKDRIDRELKDLYVERSQSLQVVVANEFPKIPDRHWEQVNPSMVRYTPDNNKHSNVTITTGFAGVYTVTGAYTSSNNCATIEEALKTCLQNTRTTLDSCRRKLQELQRDYGDLTNLLMEIK